jgi:hypothetical protein
MSRGGAYSHVLTHLSRMSGKHLQIRIAIYPLYVFPNVALWRSGSFRDVSGPQESTP